MSLAGGIEPNLFDKEEYAELMSLDCGEAIAHLMNLCRTENWSLSAVANALALAALDEADEAPHTAICWLNIAETLIETEPNISVSAQIAYARAKLATHAGDFVQAKEQLQRAQRLWHSANDSISVARTMLGLTQVLTLQGDYPDAERAIHQAVAVLEDATRSDPPTTLLLISALHNQANLFGYQHKHQAAIEIYAYAQQRLQEYRATVATEDLATAQQLVQEEARIAVSQAVDLMALSQVQEAEQALKAAIRYFQEAQNTHLRSHAYSNLASLYARTGQYTEALVAFEEAIQILWNRQTMLDELPIEELYAADVMLLDQALVFLALNLRDEAGHALALSEKLFIHAQRPYELGQTLYARGLFYMQSQEWELASQVHQQAVQIFTELHNQYWHNRTILAQTILLQQQGNYAEATKLINSLMIGDSLALDDQWYGWDLGTAIELFLQKLQISLCIGKLADARHAALLIEEIFQRHFADLSTLTADKTSLDESSTAQGESTFVAIHELPASSGVPHLRFAYQYALGRIEFAEGNLRKARIYFQRAVTILEAQRATLPLEEIRIAFLGDKATIYTSWLLTLLNTDEEMNSQLIAEAFSIVERARSRALTERLLAALESPVEQSAKWEDFVSTDSLETELLSVSPEHEITTQRNLARRQLHWLYNQLLGQDGPSRLQQHDIQRIRQLEFRLGQLEAKSALPVMSTPADLESLQAVLQPREHVLAYYIADEEVLLFHVTSDTVQLYRRLCSLSQLSKTQRDLQFQLGRVRSGQTMLDTLDQRSQRLLLKALNQLYELLVAPVREKLTGERLRIIPYGILHQIPFHTLWTGNHYLIEEYECCYVPSASITVYQAKRPIQDTNLTSWSGFAVTEQDIPETANEVKQVAQLFERPQLYLDAQANRQGLATAAANTEILHISTHGLMRSDNPLFSSLKLADGWINVREIYQLKLHAHLVVLSACRSGLSKIEHGDEMIGVARGFLGAGAHTLIVSQWDVDDSYAPTFMFYFYQKLIEEKQKPATALRMAQCHAIEQGHHPFWWAPFFVIG